MVCAHLYELAYRFKEAIVQAYEAGRFDNDITFCNFPRGCCGDTCDLLAEYLRNFGIETVYVCGSELDQSHAWLVIKDSSIEKPKSHHYELSDEIRDVFSLYSGGRSSGSIDNTYYDEMDLINGTIVDITADQFGERSVYVDRLGKFHKRFDFNFAYDCVGIDNPRLRKIYEVVMEYILR